MNNYNIIDDLFEDEIIELSITVYDLIDDYIKYNLIEMYEPTFCERMCYDISELLFNDLCGAQLYDYNNDDKFNYLYKFVSTMIYDYFELTNNWENIPLRFRQHVKHSINVKEITKKINKIRSIPQPEQRTKEWYEFRYHLITASNLGKIFGSESTLNSLIYEKCSPLKEVSENGFTYVNTQSPLHWGQKYEPVSVMLYEKLYNTKVEDFGCIQHENYNFIGASPDGIVVDSKSDRYGRMLEIKNIVNREINGNPSKNYWIQMQVQMETCDLDQCDFLETRIKEYSESEFYDDVEREKGVILYFVERISIGGGFSVEDNNEEPGYMLAQQYSGVPHYEYMPLEIAKDKESIDKWIESKRNNLRRTWSLYSAIYWYLDELSCVLVERNKLWFNVAVDKIQETWNIILKERETGYEHRAAKKKVKTTLEITESDDKKSKIIKNLPISGGICLVKLDHDEIQ